MELVFSGDSNMIYYGPDIEAYVAANYSDPPWAMTRVDLNWDFLLSRITHFWNSEGEVARDMVNSYINQLYNNGTQLVGSIGPDVVIPVWFDFNDKHLQILHYVNVKPMDWGKVFGDALWATVNVVTGANFTIDELQSSIAWVSGVANNPVVSAISSSNASASQQMLASAKGVPKQPPRVVAPVTPGLNVGDFTTPLILGAAAFVLYKVLF